MNQSTFHSVNNNFIVEKIKRAEQSVFLAAPGITISIVDALIECAKKLEGWEEITIVIDPSPKIYYLGYGESGALEKLDNNGCKVRCENNLRVGLLIVDQDVHVFSPLSLNLESDDEYEESINGLTLNKEGAKYVIEKINPSFDDKEPDIGSREMSEIEIKIIEHTLKNNPPQKPDLTRKINVITSQFQFVHLSFKGSQLKNTKISLNARELGIKDEDLLERIFGQYKVFEQLPQKYEKGIYDLKFKFKKLKERYTKTIGEYGTIIWVAQSKDFQNAINAFQGEIDIFNKNVVNEIVAEINKSKERLKIFINENYKIDQQQSFDNGLAKIKKEKVILNIVDKAFSAYKKEELEKGLELKCYYYNISSQTVLDEGFNTKIEEMLGVKLDELIKHTNAFTVNE
jgi:hypothetical protein